MKEASRTKAARIKARPGQNQNAEDKGADPYELLYWRDDFDGPMQSA